MEKYYFSFLLIFMQFFLFSQTKEDSYKTSPTFDSIVNLIVKDNTLKELESYKQRTFLLSKISKTKLEKSKSLEFLGKYYSKVGNIDSTRYYFNSLLNYSKKYLYKTEQHYSAVVLYSNYGMNYLDSSLIISELTSALNIIDENKYFEKKGSLCTLLGDVLLKDKEYVKAGEYYDKSFKYATTNSSKADYYFNRGNVDFELKNYEKAKQKMLKSLTFISENDKQIYGPGYTNFLNKIGEVYTKLKQYKEAKKYFVASLNHQFKYGLKLDLSLTYLLMSYLARENSNEVLEKNYLDKSIYNYKEDIYILNDIYLAYKEYYIRTKNYELAVDYGTKYQKVNENIFNIESAKQKLEIESKYQLAEKKKEIALKEEIIQKDTAIKRIYFIGFCILLALLGVVFLFYYNKIKTQKKLRKNQNLLHEEKLKLMLENQKTEIIKEKIKTQIEVSNKFSLELHDGIASEIAALKLSLSNESILQKDDIDSIVLKIDKVYNEVRNLSHDLNPDKIDEVDFSQLVKNLCLIPEKSNIATYTNINISNQIDNLDPQILLSIYRILQESVNNVIKHSAATKLYVTVFDSLKGLSISIQDNGVGFSKTVFKNGIGLKNIEKRINMLNGKLDIKSSGEGTKLEIIIPVI